MRYIKKKDKNAPSFFPTLKTVKDPQQKKEIYGKLRYELTVRVYEQYKQRNDTFDLHGVLKTCYKNIKKKKNLCKREMSGSEEDKTPEIIRNIESSLNRLETKIETEMKKLSEQITKFKNELLEPKNKIQILMSQDGQNLRLAHVQQQKFNQNRNLESDFTNIKKLDLGDNSLDFLQVKEQRPEFNWNRQNQDKGAGVFQDLQEILSEETYDQPFKNDLFDFGTLN